MPVPLAEGLPPAHLWPDRVYTLPEHRYPVRLNVARELLDNSVSTHDDIAAVTSAPILGNIQVDNRAAEVHPSTALKAATPWSEAFRVLRTNMQYVDIDHEQKVFVMTSSLPGEGKSTTAVNLAVTLTQAGQRVALVECDLRRPLIADRLELDGAIGTTSVLIGKVSAEDVMQQYADTSLDVMVCGQIPPNPSELLQSQAMEMLLLELRRHDEAWVRDRLGDRWLGFDDDELRTMLEKAGLSGVKITIGARRARDPFTVLIASGVKNVG